MEDVHPRCRNMALVVSSISWPVAWDSVRILLAKRIKSWASNLWVDWQRSRSMRRLLMTSCWSAFSAAKWSISTAWDLSWACNESRSWLLVARAADKRAVALCWHARGADASMRGFDAAPAPDAGGAPFVLCRRRRSRCLLAQRAVQNRCDARDGSKRSPHSPQIFPLIVVHLSRPGLRHDFP